MEFPELGDVPVEKPQPKLQVQQQKETQKEPVKPTFIGGKQGNKFEKLQEQEKPIPPKAEVKPEEKKEPVKPSFGGLKKILAKNQEENADLNKDLDEKIKKIQETVKIHEAKPPKRPDEEDKEFESVTDDKKRSEPHATRRGGQRGGFQRGGGRGGFGRGQDRNDSEGSEDEPTEERKERKRSDGGRGRGERPHYGREGPKPEKKQQKPENKPVERGPDVVVNTSVKASEFNGWDAKIF